MRFILSLYPISIYIIECLYIPYDILIIHMNVYGYIGMYIFVDIKYGFHFSKTPCSTSQSIRCCFPFISFQKLHSGWNGKKYRIFVQPTEGSIIRERTNYSIQRDTTTTFGKWKFTEPILVSLKSTLNEIDFLETTKKSFHSSKLIIKIC